MAILKRSGARKNAVEGRLTTGATGQGVHKKGELVYDHFTIGISDDNMSLFWSMSLSRTEAETLVQRLQTLLAWREGHKAF